MTHEQALIAIAEADAWTVEKHGGQPLAEYMRQIAVSAIGMPAMLETVKHGSTAKRRQPGPK